MKRVFYISTFFIFLITQFLFINPIKSTSTVSADDGWKNYYAVWQDTGTNAVKYAKQMGYEYINVQGYKEDYYKNNSDCAGLKFYIVNPQMREDLYKEMQGWASLPSNTAGGGDIVTTYSYTQEQIDWYNQHMVWKSNDSFPNNLATGWFSGTSTRFSAMWDFQQQAVIDYVVEKIVAYVKKHESQTLPFTFAGYQFDVPELTGDFHYWNNGNKSANLTNWTGSDSGLVHGTITHEYSTYSDGMAAFYKQLMTTTRKIYPDAKWIIDPALIYDSSLSYDEYVYTVKSRTDKAELTPDMLMQEDAGTDVMATKFVDNTNNFTSGMNITESMVGNHQRGSVGESRNRAIAAKAAINGAWYNWFGNLGGQGDMPSFGGSITNVYPRLKLVRCIPNWDNLNNVPLADRSWDGSVYQSTKSYISSDVMYSRHTKTGKLFAVFNTTNGVITLNEGETVTSMQNTDGYFIESGDASADFDITGSEIRLKSSVTIDTDSSNGQIKGKGYIFTLKESGTPTVTTGSATDVTSNSATLNGTVNGDGLSTTAWFEYDTISGSYSNKSATQSVSGSSDTTVSISISGLSPAKTYYYRIAAQNSAGTANGSEMSFTTSDTNAPAGSININSGDSYTNSTAVTLSLSATDDVGITGYFLSSNATTPPASDAGWTSVTSTTNYSGSVSYTLGSGDGKKTVYVWYKDASGNVSSPALDSISLDTTAPAITITNPTYNSTYTTTSSTMSLGGDVSDSASGVSSITWSNDKGGSGTTSGATGWLFSSITLSSGDNVITVTATDKANNTSTATITVTYGAAPSVSMGSATNLTSNSVTLNETVNANGLSTTVWFEYGLNSGSYGSKSATQVISGDSDTVVSASVSGLMSGKTYYYRSVAQNSVGTTYGSEKSFTTLDTTAPTSSIGISGGASYTKSSTITLNLSATDDVGVTGYYLSANSTTPSASVAGWASITSTTSYSGSISYTLSNGDGNKTVYAWYKDAAGNVSIAASDSITLDTTTPAITITSPTSSATYTTASTTISLGGSASDSGSGVSSVTWSSDKGGSGTASGTTNWSISGITLSSGNNVITVTVTDGANNSNSATITVTYGGAPAATTGSATNVTSNSATLDGTVNANYLSATAWFEYSVTSGSYDSKSSTQTVSGSSNTLVNISISGLSAGKVYYYRIVAQNGAGTTYGTEKSFTTPDNTPPDCLIIINNEDAYTNTTNVTLALSATDDIGVTGYFLSSSSTVPSAAAAGWTSVTSTTSFSANVQYTLDSGDGSKTLYVWYKDAAGNISTAANDSITLDTTAPVITITSPASSSTYTTTNGTLSLGGSASDTTSGVSSVTWSNDKGGSGTASGTTNWTISDITLSSGDNVITVTATDGINNAGSATITVTVNSSSGSTSTGLQAFYTFDEGSGTIANDSSGNGNNGTINGATWTTGKIGSALNFSGTGSYVSLSSSLPSFSEFTASAWVKVIDLTAIRGIFTSGGKNGNGFRFRINKDGSVWMLMAGGGSYDTLSTAAGVVQRGTFYHISVTGKSGQYMRIYVNGSLVKEKTTTQTVDVPTASGYIGTSWNTSSELMNGTIDDVCMYNYVLSSQEVLKLYNNGLQAFYTFDEGSGTIANDSSGNGNNGTINGATWTTGKIGSALNFSGTGSYVSLSNSLSSLSEFTGSAWVKVTDLTAHRGIFTSGGLNGNGFRFRINNDGSVYLLMAGGGSYDKLVTSAGTVQSGTFYHISVTGKSGQYMRIYVNGSLVKEKTTTQTVDAPTAPGYIGTSWNTSLDLMNGTIDDVRIYNRVLSSQEIQDMYNQ